MTALSKQQSIAIPDYQLTVGLIMAHLVDQSGAASAGAVSLFAAAAAAMDTDAAEISAEFAAVTRAAALVSPSEGEYEYIMGRVRELMEEGRGETIMELGQGEDTEGITDEEMAASVATLK